MQCAVHADVSASLLEVPPVLAEADKRGGKDKDDQQEVQAPIQRRSFQVERKQQPLRRKGQPQKCLHTIAAEWTGLNLDHGTEGEASAHNLYNRCRCRGLG